MGNNEKFSIGHRAVLAVLPGPDLERQSSEVEVGKVLRHADTLFIDSDAYNDCLETKEAKRLIATANGNAFKSIGLSHSAAEFCYSLAAGPLNEAVVDGELMKNAEDLKGVPSVSERSFPVYSVEDFKFESVKKLGLPSSYEISVGSFKLTIYTPELLNNVVRDFDPQHRLRPYATRYLTRDACVQYSGDPGRPDAEKKVLATIMDTLFGRGQPGFEQPIRHHFYPIKLTRKTCRLGSATSPYLELVRQESHVKRGNVDVHAFENDTLNVRAPVGSNVTLFFGDVAADRIPSEALHISQTIFGKDPKAQDVAQFDLRRLPVNPDKFPKVAVVITKPNGAGGRSVLATQIFDLPPNKRVIVPSENQRDPVFSAAGCHGRAPLPPTSDHVVGAQSLAEHINEAAKKSYFTLEDVEKLRRHYENEIGLVVDGSRYPWSAAIRDVHQRLAREWTQEYYPELAKVLFA